MRMTDLAMAQFGWRVAAGTLAVTTALLVATRLGLATPLVPRSFFEPLYLCRP